MIFFLPAMIAIFTMFSKTCYTFDKLFGHLCFAVSNRLVAGVYKTVQAFLLIEKVLIEEETIIVKPQYINYIHIPLSYIHFQLGNKNHLSSASLEKWFRG